MDRRSRIIGVALLALLVMGAGMGLLGRKVWLFSETSGVVTRGGEPVAGVEVERAWQWNGDRKSTTTRTGPDGRFRFPAVTDRSLSSFLPGEVVIDQEITLRHDGSDYLAWQTAKRNYDENGELDGRPLELRCDLDAEPKVKEIGFKVIRGLCTWDD